MKAKKILVTGAAGFIGSSLSQRLLSQGYHVVGLDNLTLNYPLRFKKANLARLVHPHFYFIKADIRNKKKLSSIFKNQSFATVIHLAALTGVRASLLNPDEFHEVNTLGTKNLYELSAQYGVTRFIFSSSSSVYGKGSRVASVETQHRHPRSPYAVSKKNAEDVLKKLHSKYHTPTFIFRLFSVYGPYGRPDMAPYLFTEAALHNRRIEQFGDGETSRDYTYIDDVLNALCLSIDRSSDTAIINIGSFQPIKLRDLIFSVEKYTQRKVLTNILPTNNMESSITYANISQANKLLHWKPSTSFDKGMKQFVQWYMKNRL